jgi:transcriptional antiterminator RfaH
MPILHAETDRYPEELFEGLAPPEPDARWWVLHTRPRQEKSLARDLLARGTSFFLPQIRRRSLIRGRAFTARIPLFPSYLFLLADDHQRVAALTTRHVVRTLRVVDQDQMWEELSQIQRLIGSGAPITPEDRLAPGSNVEICSGPLSGMRGTILRTGSARRFVVQVDFIQRGASVELGDDTLLRAC